MIEVFTLPVLYGALAGAGVTAGGVVAYKKAAPNMKAWRLRRAISLVKEAQGVDNTKQEETDARAARESRLVDMLVEEAAKLPKKAPAQ